MRAASIFVRSSVLGLGLLVALLDLSQAAISIPSLRGPVMDDAQFLTSTETDLLDKRIRQLMPHIQIQIWTVASLEGEPIESLSIRAVDQWKLGDQKRDNGLLILASKSDRAVRLEVGQGLEGDITDSLSGRIIDYLVVPAFRDGRYADGFIAAIDEIAVTLKLTSEPSKIVVQGRDFKTPVWLLLILLLLVHIGLGLLLMAARSLGLVRGPRSSNSWTTGSWGAGGSRGWGGGFGGGWSGGGGGFSGGGASGRW